MFSYLAQTCQLIIFLFEISQVLGFVFILSHCFSEIKNKIFFPVFSLISELQYMFCGDLNAILFRSVYEYKRLVLLGWKSWNVKELWKWVADNHLDKMIVCEFMQVHVWWLQLLQRTLNIGKIIFSEMIAIIPQELTKKAFHSLKINHQFYPLLMNHYKPNFNQIFGWRGFNRATSFSKGR